ncbi:MAG: metal-sensing transcriptional repressor [Candidatus Poribacteria bacterium]|nr:metal-sensing transcriptional repressor [Candidatus Poribacteria bacterium]
MLIQIAAVQSALQRTGKLILEEHLERCITEAVQDGDQKEPLDKFKDALAKFIR